MHKNLTRVKEILQAYQGIYLVALKTKSFLDSKLSSKSS